MSLEEQPSCCLVDEVDNICGGSRIKLMKNKSITIDDLAGMVQGEFGEMHQKLNKLEKNDQVILKKLEGIVYRYEFDELQTRVKDLENLLAVGSKKR